MCQLFIASPGGESGFQVTGMIEWRGVGGGEGIKTQKNPLTKN